MAENDLENESAAALLTMKNQSRNSISSGSVVPSRRDCSPRIRKKNRLIYNDHEDTSYPLPRSAPRRATRLSTDSQLATNPVPDKRVAQKVGLKLRNVLKLPKAHRFLCCEWFYSNIDQPLFLRECEFMVCLKTHFPTLKKQNLARVEWCKIRRLLGKPRRCSPAFFAEERQALETKRRKIRHLQQRKTADLSQFQDLPSEIPLPLVIGMKATARVRSPQDGLFYGSIDAVDTSNHTYRITFDRPGLGTFSIPDYEVLSNEPIELMPITAFSLKYRPRSLFTPRYHSPSDDVFSDGTPIKMEVNYSDDGTLGGFPKKLLSNLVRVTKILSYKKRNIGKLREMHLEAEYNLSRGLPMTFEFQKSYAAVVLEFEKLDKDLALYMNEVLNYCKEIAPEHGIEFIREPMHLKKQCFKDAMEFIDQQSLNKGRAIVKNKRIVHLIANLTSILTQAKSLASDDYNSFEFTSLAETMGEVQAKLHPQNVPVYQNEVMIHLNHIQSAISQSGTLQAFSETES